MNARVQHHVAGRLSLRPPQAESLAKLIAAISAAPELLEHDVNGQSRDVTAILNSLKAEFKTLEDFEREFPSLCFALATGVGKTRLMGAFIAYLHLAHGINNFFVLAPNLTIYNKLISDFTPNTAKYVFKGIAEFAQQPPLIITGDNYDQSGAAVADAPSGFAHDVRINIFNISKINSEVRGGKEPRIKRMKEVLGDSYFNHLANLPDLLMLMDESHRYRASAGVRSINELRPLMGLEVTASPHDCQCHSCANDGELLGEGQQLRSEGQPRLYRVAALQLHRCSWSACPADPRHLYRGQQDSPDVVWRFCQVSVSTAKV